MSDAAVSPAQINPTAPPPIVYEPNEAKIAVWKAELAERIPDPVEAVKTPAGYELVRKAIHGLRTSRVAIEKKRVELKAGALAYGREVDGKARHYTELIEEIEGPLKAAKQVEDDRKEAEKRAAEEAEKARIAAEEKAKRDAEEARLKAIRDAEEARLAAERQRLEAERAKMEAERKAQEEARRIERERIEAEQRAERERLAAERARIEAEQRAADEKARQEREKLEAERRAVQAEKERLDRIEFERQAKEKAAAEAKERAEREAQERAAAAERKRLEEERLAKEKAEAQAAEAKRQEEMRPDIEKIHRFASTLEALELPKVQSPKAVEVLALVRDELKMAINACRNFGQRARSARKEAVRS